MKNLLYILFMIVFVSAKIYSQELNDKAQQSNNLEKIRKSISEKNANWKAEENWITRLTSVEQNKLFGNVIDLSNINSPTLINLPKVKDLPIKFDWRNNNGNWISPVKNQGLCGSCWAFSAVAQIEAWWKIYKNSPDSVIDLSEQFLLSCSNAGSCNGGSITDALEFIKDVGIPQENCFPYSANDLISCSNVCINWKNEVVKIPGWNWITNGEALIDNIKNAVFIHPVSAFLEVYTDLKYYSSGIYQHVLGEYETGHWILIVGWNDEEESWICKNSWGTNWGERGYFRIKWGDCKIGTLAPFIWEQVTGSTVVTASPQKYDLSLISGSTTIQELTIKNRGQNIFEYITKNFSTELLFHPDNFCAWEGLSWWCGDTVIGGYNNNNLQFLETPLLDLSNTNLPQLNWMGLWALEDTAAASFLTSNVYDGWDGCNVWVSVNGGYNFNVAYPTYPKYNCTNLYSFGNPDTWDLGVIPGWGGSNGGWIPVQFDLSSYKSDSVMIRFAFASDESYCTLDESNLKGFFIDDIKISDDSVIIFEDYADDITAMNQLACGSKAADWIELSNSVGQLQTNEAQTIYIKIDAENLTPGDYNGSVEITSNDTTLSRIIIPIHLKVTPVVGIDKLTNSIPDRYKLEQNYPNPFNPTTTIKYSVPDVETRHASSLQSVTLKVYDILSREIAVLVNEEQKFGNYEVRWDAGNLSSGVYFYRIRAGSFVETRKMILMK